MKQLVVASSNPGKLREIETMLDEAGAQVVGLVRNEVRVTAPRAGRIIRAGDILVIEAEAEALATVLASLGLKLEEAQKKLPSGKDEGDARNAEPEAQAAAAKRTDLKAEPPSDEITLMELAVLPGSMLVDRSAIDIQLRTHYGINLLAVSRQGRRSMTRLRSMRLASGDLLLMQGAPETIAEFAASAGCVPLAERELRIPDKRKAIAAAGIMVAAVGVAAFGLLPAAVSFTAGVLASMALRTVPPRAVMNRASACASASEPPTAIGRPLRPELTTDSPER